MVRFIQRRLDYIDTAKAVAIMLVIIGHTPLYEPLQKWVYVFHVPLFFFISGYLFSFRRNPNFKDFVKKRFKQIALPYVVVNLLTWSFWAVVARRYSVGSDYSGIPLWKPLEAAFLGYGMSMIHCTAMWFVGCLLVIEILYYLLFRNRSGKMRFVLVLEVFTIGWINSCWNGDRLPFFAGQALMGLCFYAVGNEMRQMKLAFDNGAVALLSLVVTILAAAFNERVDSCANFYGNVVMYLVGGLAGVYATLYACRTVDAIVVRVRDFIRFVANDTLLICGFHLVAMSCVKGIMAYGFGYDISLLAGGIWGNLVLALVCLVVCCVSIFIYRRLSERFSLF